MVSLRNLVGIDADGNIFNNKWIEWSHFLIPNKQYLLRELIRKIMASRGHCLTCTILDGCYFLEDKKPEIPLHLNCDCRNINIDYRKVQKMQVLKFQS